MATKNTPYALPVATPITKLTAAVKLPRSVATEAASEDTPGATKVKIRRPAKAKAAEKPAIARYPWHEMSEDAMQTYVIDLPAKLHCKLKWLGGVTWDSSMRKLTVIGLEAFADEQLKAHGLNEEDRHG